jgi:transaldolase
VEKVEPRISDLKVKIFADGADLQGMFEMASKPYISGLTTNPTLMRKSGVKDYELFAKEALESIDSKPISFEVFSDEIDEMKAQGKKIASWGDNVYVKIPITNTRGESTKSALLYLTDQGIKVNVTALMTTTQIEEIVDVLNPSTPSYVSIFAGRIADTARDPIPMIRESLEILSKNPNSELIWASPRELLNIFQANEVGCHVITATNEILKKLELINKDLADYSLETVKMFYNDAKASGYKIT